MLMPRPDRRGTSMFPSAPVADVLCPRSAHVLRPRPPHPSRKPLNMDNNQNLVVGHGGSAKVGHIAAFR